MGTALFADRADAGRRLGELVAELLGDPAGPLGRAAAPPSDPTSDPSRAKPAPPSDAAADPSGAEPAPPGDTASARQHAGREGAGREGATREGGGGVGPGVVVLGLPRGGVSVAAEVARVLGAPLDAFVVRKLAVPGRPELAMGAIAGGVLVWNDVVFEAHRPDRSAVEAVLAAERAELARRERAYRGDRPAPDLRGRLVVLVDDGVATGATARAALRAVRALHPRAVLFAAPVVPARLDLRPDADATVALATPRPFGSVSDWYRNFDQVTDRAVRTALDNGLAT